MFIENKKIYKGNNFAELSYHSEVLYIPLQSVHVVYYRATDKLN